MGLFTALDRETAHGVGMAFGLDLTCVEPLAAGSVNSNFRVTDASGRRYFARVYEEQGEDGALAELRLLRELSAAGVPTVAPLDPGSGEVPRVAGKPFAMYPWIDGDIVCQRGVTVEQCRAVGVALASLHAATGRVTALPGGRFRIQDVRGRLDRIERESPEHRDAALHVRRRLEHYAARRATDLPSGVIHGDLFRDNVLWAGGRIAALIDFESASHGPFAFDLMVTVLAWCFGDALDTRLASALFAGYSSVRPLDRLERGNLLTEGALACLRFATTRITDFSMRAPPGVPPLRDYRRFLARLEALEHGVLDACSV